MSTAASSSLPDSIICANCGKGEESSGDLKACTACKMVKYCNRDCQIAHRSQHKKACKKRATELYDKALFKEPPWEEDCPICFLPLPSADQVTFESCCGKYICDGCIYAMIETCVLFRSNMTTSLNGRAILHLATFIPNFSCTFILGYLEFD